MVARAPSGAFLLAWGLGVASPFAAQAFDMPPLIETQEVSLDAYVDQHELRHLQDKVLKPLLKSMTREKARLTNEQDALDMLQEEFRNLKPPEYLQAERLDALEEKLRRAVDNIGKQSSNLRRQKELFESRNFKLGQGKNKFAFEPLDAAFQKVVKIQPQSDAAARAKESIEALVKEARAFIQKPGKGEEDFASRERAVHEEISKGGDTDHLSQLRVQSDLWLCLRKQFRVVEGISKFVDRQRELSERVKFPNEEEKGRRDVIASQTILDFESLGQQQERCVRQLRDFTMQQRALRSFEAALLQRKGKSAPPVAHREEPKQPIVAVPPRNAPGSNELSRLLRDSKDEMLNGRYDEALPIVWQIVERFPKQWEGHFLLAKILNDPRYVTPQEAESAAQKALGLAASDREKGMSHLELAVSQFAQSKTDKSKGKDAVENARKCVEFADKAGDLGSGERCRRLQEDARLESRQVLFASRKGNWLHWDWWSFQVSRVDRRFGFWALISILILIIIGAGRLLWWEMQHQPLHEDSTAVFPSRGQSLGEVAQKSKSLMGGKYEFIRLIRRAGIGVHEARHFEDGHLVALRKIDPGSAHAAIAEALKDFEHFSIDAVRDIISDRGVDYLVYDPLNGKTIQAALRDGARFTVAESKLILNKVCCGLDGAHEKHIPHAGLAPSRILVTPEGQVKVSDFPVFLEPAEGAIYSRPGCTPGSPNVSDNVYSLGVSFYEMLSGKLPFGDGGGGAYVPLASIVPGIRPEVDRFVRAALGREPGRSIAGARDFAEQMERLPG